jgi:DNA-binding transcriptional LysR family regulator
LGDAPVFQHFNRGWIAKVIRYDERLEQGMIAVPVGPRVQRFATAASPAYLDVHGTPKHPPDLLAHACRCSQFASGAMPTSKFEREGEVVRLSAAVDRAVAAAVYGLGIINLVEDWLRPRLNSGTLVLEHWWQSFSGRFLYDPGRRYVPARTGRRQKNSLGEAHRRLPQTINSIRPSLILRHFFPTWDA